MLHKIHFSIKEAKRLLPAIRIKLAKIVKLKATLDQQGYDIYKHPVFGGISTNGIGKFPPEMEDLLILSNEISAEGILIKGIDNGLIDFPHIRENGEEVYLCYLLEEEDIEFWHSIDDGFAGRKDIDDI